MDVSKSTGIVDLKTKTKVFRFKFTDDIMKKLSSFSKIHQYDDRHSYKDAWNFWLNENRDMVDREITRLTDLGYNGDIEDKMFKAGRYYFREKKGGDGGVTKKNDTTSAGSSSTTEMPSEPTTKNKRDYITIDPIIIQSMDNHLKEMTKTSKFKPANAYINYTEMHLDLIRTESMRLKLTVVKNGLTAEQLSNKFKKTYKNRYFILTNKDSIASATNV